MLTHSIRWRLQWWIGFLLLCVLSGFGFTAYQLQRVSVINRIDKHLEYRVAAISRDLRGRGGPGEPPGGMTFEDGPGRPSPRRTRPDAPPSRGGAEPRSGGPPRAHLSAQTLGLFNTADAESFYYVVWGRDENRDARSTNAPSLVPRPELVKDEPGKLTRTRGPFREAYYFNAMGECVLAGRPVAPDLAALRHFAWWLVAAGAGVLALGLGGGWWLTTSAIRPVEEISAAASRISAGNLSERITATDPRNELGQLAGVLNSTFARLEGAFARQRQFTTDASHELRTPLAVLISEAQATLARERTPAEYRETIETCLDTAQQMRRLTESLLELARSDAAQEVLPRVRLDLAEIARGCVEQLRPLAGARGLRLHCDLAAAAASSQADRLGQVITNLLTNAIQYNKPAGEIRVVTRADGAAALLTIADTGEGIAAEHLPHIFERFYRADASRSSASGHFGLGLAICKAIVDADQGSIEVTSQPGAGPTFTVRLPAPAAN
jgi:signal transduction histidine kinase